MTNLDRGLPRVRCSISMPSGDSDQINDRLEAAHRLQRGDRSASRDGVPALFESDRDPHGARAWHVVESPP
jgi:hypothetical protein